MKPLLVFCLAHMECPLRRVIEEALKIGDSSNGNYGATGAPHPSTTDGNGVANFPLAARILYSTCSPAGNRETEVWARFSGRPGYVKSLEQAAGRCAGVRYQVVYQTRFNKVMRLVWDSDTCKARSTCLIASKPSGIMVKSVIVLPEGVLFELIVAKTSALRVLERTGCEIIRMHEIDEMDYMLTEKQESALINAYMSGYYRFPRNISLKDLASSMGLSASSLAELLRKAEIKVIEAFIRHEMPHYMVYALLSRSLRRRVERRSA